MKCIKYYLLPLLLLFLSTANGESTDLFKLNTTNKRAFAHQKELKEFLTSVEDVLPSLIKEKLNEQVLITFKRFDENKSIDKLPSSRCNNEAVGFIYGRVNHAKKHAEIEISELLLEAILSGDINGESFKCGHKNYYRKAIAVIAHEVSHLFDELNIRTQEHKKNYWMCRDLESESMDSDDGGFNEAEEKYQELYGFCKAVYLERSTKGSVSGLYNYQKLIGRDIKMFKDGFKNKGQKRSPNRYEFKNLRENFSVNFEFFLLDRNYKCKRPTYYKFFSEYFNHSPFENNECQIMTKVPLDDGKDVANPTIRDIAPSKVYQVHYLLASKGDSMISGFGHSMFRLITCAPHRTEVGPECLEDTLYHVVLSYRANVTDIKSNTIKGLTGGYDSVLFMLPFPKVVEEYNQGELRDLISLPLELTEQEKKSFMLKTLETFWEYEGKYKFITSNCASESHSMLQSSLLNRDIKFGKIILPYSLYDQIIETGLSSESYLENEQEAVKNGFLFKSDLDHLLKVIERQFGIKKERNLIKRWIFKPGVKEILMRLTVEDIKRRYDEVKAMELDDPRLALEHYKDLAVLTGSLMTINRKELDDKIGTFLQKRESKKDEFGLTVKRWSDLRQDVRKSSYNGGYGIPTDISLQKTEKFIGDVEEYKSLEKNLLDEVISNFETEVEDLKEWATLRSNIRRSKKVIRLVTLYL